MAAPREETVVSPLKSPTGTPRKIRELINEGIVSGERNSDGKKETAVLTEDSNGCELTSDNNSCETTSRDAFFSRVESFSISFPWAGKPSELSPLTCAKYGWANIECDMLKCSSCNAYLCASLQPALDYGKYKRRCVELQEGLRNAHEKYCFWPDSPCPDHFWALLVTEPSSVLNEFVERFQNLCHLELQLPSLRPEDLKSMDLTEETVSVLLQLIEDEIRLKEGRENIACSLVSDSLQVHISACILALCGWNSSPSSASLAIINCPRCMRKVGLWGFQQLEAVDLDTSLGTPSTPVSPGEGHCDRTPLGIMSPNRRVTRSRDIDQSPTMANSRTRSFDFSSPTESDPVRSRPVTRSMGQGESSGLGTDMHSSPHRRAKRPRLCSSSSSTDTSPRGCFDPLTQHKNWCPWVNLCKADMTEKTGNGDHRETDRAKNYGWKDVLQVLLAEAKSRTLSDLDSSSVPEKSCKVFRIFRQWQATVSS
ncbi:zinc finger C3HC-type protein 1 [Rhinophrynus dorsalis]